MYVNEERAGHVYCDLKVDGSIWNVTIQVEFLALVLSDFNLGACKFKVIKTFGLH